MPILGWGEGHALLARVTRPLIICCMPGLATLASGWDFKSTLGHWFGYLHKIFGRSVLSVLQRLLFMGNLWRCSVNEKHICTLKSACVQPFLLSCGGGHIKTQNVGSVRNVPIGGHIDSYSLMLHIYVSFNTPTEWFGSDTMDHIHYDTVLWSDPRRCPSTQVTSKIVSERSCSLSGERRWKRRTWSRRDRSKAKHFDCCAEGEVLPWNWGPYPQDWLG